MHLAVLRRLLHIRRLHEEQAQAALESAQNALHAVRNAQAAAAAEERHGRSLATDAIAANSLVDRLSGLQLSAVAHQAHVALSAACNQAEQVVAEARASFLVLRVERRQAESLVIAAETRETEVTRRREQQASDDRHRDRMRTRRA